MMSDKPIILYVEDDELSRQVMQMLVVRGMGNPNLTIWSSSENFEERLSQLTQKPTVILLDIHVPPYNGFQMYEMLRKHPDSHFHSVPVIALTASVMNDEVAQLKSLGLDGVIAKPVSQKAFPQLLQRVINGEKVWHIR